MGQCYNIVLGDVTGGKFKVYSQSKLVEHGYLGNTLNVNIENKLLKSYKRILWVGQYVESLTKGCLDEGISYYEKVRRNVGDSVIIPTSEEIMSDEAFARVPKCKDIIDWDSYYLINKDKKEYLKMSDYIRRSVHQEWIDFVVLDPLTFLTAVGTELGSEHNWITDTDMVGRWAWNLIGIRNKVPKGFTEITPTIMVPEIQTRFLGIQMMKSKIYRRSYLLLQMMRLLRHGRKSCRKR